MLFLIGVQIQCAWGCRKTMYNKHLNLILQFLQEEGESQLFQILRISVQMDVKTGELLDTVWGLWLWSCGPSHHISTKWHSIKMQRIVFCLGRTSTITSAQQRRNMKTTDKYRGAAPAACGHLKPIKNFTCYCVITMCENIHYVRRKGCSPHGH